jgi:glycosyltransferase involved in cell wall biosynthesis
LNDAYSGPSWQRLAEGDNIRIGIIAPPWVSVPPPAYGGTEAVIDVLARGLAAAGHEVVLFATGDSTCAVERAAALAVAPGINVGGSAVEVFHLRNAYERFDAVDIIHDHTTLGPLLFGRNARCPVVATNHNPFAEPFASLYSPLHGEVPIIALSRHHASTAAPTPIAAVIHHGLVAEEFPLGDGEGGYALFLGRMTPEKGPDRAVRIAQALGVPLVLAGKMHTDAELDYFDDKIRPHLGDDVEYAGEVGRKDKIELLARARCLLNPIAWDEPFGMVMIEALACGTPVLALAYGAAPEIVEPGETGFLAGDEEGLVEGLERVGEIDRARCRAAVEGYFSQRRMVADHLRLYSSVCDAWRLQ